MLDREYLIWIHERLEYVYHENPLSDYMHKLRGIILRIPKNQESQPSCNSLEQLKEKLEIVDEYNKK